MINMTVVLVGSVVSWTLAMILRFPSFKKLADTTYPSNMFGYPPQLAQGFFVACFCQSLPVSEVDGCLRKTFTP